MNGLEKQIISSYTTDQPVRLNKFLSDAGYCSRRQADILIQEGKVKVNGRVAELGTKVLPGETVEAEGHILTRNDKIILLALHKPAGVECTTANNNPDNIIDFMNYPERVYPIGRLDKNSTGLLLLTNTGELVNAISRSSNRHEKEYIVQVNKPLTEDFLNKMRNGIYLEELGVTTRRCKVTRDSNDTFHIVLTQGYNRQIRRMCSSLGYKVIRLHRIRIMNILLGNLKEGSYRHVSGAELKELLKQIDADSLKG